MQLDHQLFDLTPLDLQVPVHLMKVPIHIMKAPVHIIKPPIFLVDDALPLLFKVLLRCRI